MDNLKMLHAMFAEATIGILVVNKDGVIVQANPFLEKLFGYQSGELISKKLETLLPESYRHRHVQHRDNYHQKPIPRTMGANLNLKGQRNDGSLFPIEISLSSMEIDGERYAIAYANDDTEQQRILEELRENKNKIKEYSDLLEQKVIARTEELATSEAKLKISLEKANELNELKSRFVSMASHEFRTPLTSILSSANLIGRYEKTEQQDKRTKHVKRIESSVRNLTSILNDFLSLEKIETGKVRYQFTHLDFCEFVQHILDEVNLMTKPNQKITHQHQGEKEVCIDEHLLKNILINLLSNGIKYSPEDKNVELFSYHENGMLKIEVKDYGIGIPKADQPNMFTRFFRANNVTNIQGTGLGLTIVKRYLDLMNGKIWFESEEGKGTSFFLEIPVFLDDKNQP